MAPAFAAFAHLAHRYEKSSFAVGAQGSAQRHRRWQQTEAPRGASARRRGHHHFEQFHGGMATERDLGDAAERWLGWYPRLRQSPEQ